MGTEKIKGGGGGPRLSGERFAAKIEREKQWRDVSRWRRRPVKRGEPKNRRCPKCTNQSSNGVQRSGNKQEKKIRGEGKGRLRKEGTGKESGLVKNEYLWCARLTRWKKKIHGTQSGERGEKKKRPDGGQSS